MTWLFPLYLLGAAAVVAPILLHLRRKPPQERVEFSSLMFLEAQTPMPVSRRRLDHWLLLLLRCLALILLASMFARPLWRPAAADGTATAAPATLLLLDRSASMRRGDLWAQATAQVLQRVRAAAPDERLALMVFDRQPELLWSFAEDARAAGERGAELTRRLAATAPGFAGTDLGRALADAAGRLHGSAELRGRALRLVLVSDLQEGARLEALRGLAWPETVGVELATVAAPHADNLSLALAASAPEAPADSVGPAAGPAAATPRVRLSNARDSRVADFTLAWETGGGEAVAGHLPAGASRVLRAPPANDRGRAVVLRLQGDAWDFDNRVFVAPPQPRRVRLGWLQPQARRDEAASPLYYLARALQPTDALKPELETRPADRLDGLQVAFLRGGDAGALRAQRAWIEAGGLGIWMLEPATRAAEVEALTGGRGLRLREAATADYRMLGEVDTAHPLLRPFADPRLRDFTKLRFWHHRELAWEGAPPAGLAVLARFDTADPALLSLSLGKGSLLLLTSGWHPADSQLALSTKFVPLLYGWLAAAGFGHESAASLLVGDALPSEAVTEIRTPDGSRLQPQAGAAVHAGMPGLYQLSRPGETPVQVAVNLPPEEGRITPLHPDRLRELGLRLKAATAADRGEAAAERLALAEQEARQRAWLWLLGGLLAVLGAETWLAGRKRQAAAAYS